MTWDSSSVVVITMPLLRHWESNALWRWLTKNKEAWGIKQRLANFCYMGMAGRWSPLQRCRSLAGPPDERHAAIPWPPAPTPTGSGSHRFLLPSSSDFSCLIMRCIFKIKTDVISNFLLEVTKHKKTWQNMNSHVKQIKENGVLLGSCVLPRFRWGFIVDKT